MVIVELEDEARAMRKPLERRKNTREVDITTPQPPMGIITAVVVLQVDMLEQIAVLANPLGDTGAATRHGDAHMPHVDAVTYPR